MQAKIGTKLNTLEKLPYKRQLEQTKKSNQSSKFGKRLLNRYYREVTNYPQEPFPTTCLYFHTNDLNPERFFDYYLLPVDYYLLLEDPHSENFRTQN